jgi:hypothetical protein
MPVAAATGVDKAVVGCGSRYIAARDGQYSILKQPGVRGGSKLPNLVGHARVNSEPAQNVELVVLDREAAGQSDPVRVTRPRGSNGFDYVSDGVVAENAGGSGGLSAG